MFWYNNKLRQILEHWKKNSVSQLREPGTRHSLVFLWILWNIINSSSLNVKISTFDAITSWTIHFTQFQRAIKKRPHKSLKAKMNYDSTKYIWNMSIKWMLNTVTKSNFLVFKRRLSVKWKLSTIKRRKLPWTCHFGNKNYCRLYKGQGN